MGTSKRQFGILLILALFLTGEASARTPEDVMHEVLAIHYAEANSYNYEIIVWAENAEQDVLIVWSEGRFTSKPKAFIHDDRKIHRTRAILFVIVVPKHENGDVLIQYKNFPLREWVSIWS